jgi:hypothetical protein
VMHSLHGRAFGSDDSEHLLGYGLLSPESFS